MKLKILDQNIHIFYDDPTDDHPFSSYNVLQFEGIEVELANKEQVDKEFLKDKIKENVEDRFPKIGPVTVLSMRYINPYGELVTPSDIKFEIIE